MPNEMIADRYCIFQNENELSAINALNVRHIVDSYEITPVPVCDPCLYGLTQARSEIIPVFRWKSLMRMDMAAVNEDAGHLIILENNSGPWAFTVDRVIDLVDLEIGGHQVSERSHGWKKVMMGNASYKNQIVQVMDTNQLFQYIEGLLNAYWDNATE